MASDPARPIVLTGMMLSGKSTVGALIALRLGWPFVDLDEAIEARAGRSIPNIFEHEGEAAFRDLERQTLADLLVEGGPRVIATGGGALEDEVSRARCRAGAFVVYLEATPTDLAARLSGPSGRPLLDGASEPAVVLGELLERRRENYLAAQHLTVPAAASEPEELADAIVEAYHEWSSHGSDTES